MACHRGAGRSEASVWLSELPSGASSVAVDLPLDPQFRGSFSGSSSTFAGTRTAAHWTTSSGAANPDASSAHPCLRAVDGSLKGNSYREIAQGLFGKHRTPDRGLKNRPRNRTICLVQTGLRLMRGDYRALLRRNRKDRGEGARRFYIDGTVRISQTIVVARFEGGKGSGGRG
ncbi:DUF2285 domain-containing protein [Bradyrhizobium sp. CCBAU 51627]|uniref:DUF2285 domain-containing protein n=1 Tax=Bradyrhizobium sp. CCBAU 51627 TaxID=1325088 RepID=UPI00230542AB|nr:DUF2285 domain-containing protein [Bradyrhizobium sp. CCBAU 51627]